jgi:hypothetical protein
MEVEDIWQIPRYESLCGGCTRGLLSMARLSGCAVWVRIDKSEGVVKRHETGSVRQHRIVRRVD